MLIIKEKGNFCVNPVLQNGFRYLPITQKQITVGIWNFHQMFI